MLDKIANGFTAPVSLAAPKDGTRRIFIADQIGLIRVLESNGSLLDEPLLDIRGKIVNLASNYDDRGNMLNSLFRSSYQDVSSKN